MALYTDETLMAYADGELDPAERADVEAAMRDDAAVAERVARHHAMRTMLQSAYAPELEEAPPARLLAAARAARRPAEARRWRPLLSMAASLLIGLAVGYAGLRQTNSLIGQDGGTLVARGDLADALSNQLGGDRSGSARVKIGLSFLTASGDYCRVFTLSGAASPAGVACHSSSAWQLRALAQGADATSSHRSSESYRTASSALPRLVIDAVQQQMAGEPLDENAERQARQQGWQKQP